VHARTQDRAEVAELGGHEVAEGFVGKTTVGVGAEAAELVGTGHPDGAGGVPGEGADEDAVGDGD